MNQASPRKHATLSAQWATWLLLSAAVAWSAAWFLHARGYWDDGAFRHLEFARALSRGQGFRFNGQLVYAESSPLWAWLLVTFHVAIPNWLHAGKVLTAVTAAVTLAGAFQYGRGLTGDGCSGKGRAFAALMVVLIAVNPMLERWAFSGLPSIAGVALAFWGLRLAHGRLAEPIVTSRLLGACACAGLAPLLRPEMAVFTALLGLVLFVRWINIPLRFRPKLLVFFGGVILVGAPVITWTFYALHAFGTAVPNGYGASVGSPSASSLGESLWVLLAGFPVVLFGMFGIAAWLAGKRIAKDDLSLKRSQTVARALDPTCWLSLLWTGAICLFLIAHHVRQQTPYLLVPALVLSVAVLAFARRMWPRGYAIGVGAGIAAGVAMSLLAAWPALSAESRATADYAALSSFIGGLPGGQAIAAEHVNQMAFSSGHPVVDMSGLLRPGILPFKWDVTDNRRVWWIHEQGARYLVLDHAPEPKAVPVWSTDIAPMRRSLDPGEYGAFDKLTLWLLPRSPTLPVPAEVPRDDGL